MNHLIALWRTLQSRNLKHPSLHFASQSDAVKFMDMLGGQEGFAAVTEATAEDKDYYRLAGFHVTWERIGGY